MSEQQAASTGIYIISFICFWGVIDFFLCCKSKESKFISLPWYKYINHWKR